MCQSLVSVRTKTGGEGTGTTSCMCFVRILYLKSSFPCFHYLSVKDLSLSFMIIWRKIFIQIVVTIGLLNFRVTILLKGNTLIILTTKSHDHSPYN